MSMASQYRQGLIGAGLLAVFAVVGSGLVALTFDATEERIIANERAQLLKSVGELVPREAFDNDPLTDTLVLTHTKHLGTTQPVTVYRARKDGEAVAAVFTAIAPEGYNGAIKLLVGVYADGRLAGVRVLSHRETPGLGDLIERSRTDWIDAFVGKSLSDPGPEQWKVRKDGGVFDQFTGATITPRAVVKAVHDALAFFGENRHRLFVPPEPQG
jgi:electron transport complex protein RnfG